jgi:YaiO family outer membrane protein
MIASVLLLAVLLSAPAQEAAGVAAAMQDAIETARRGDHPRALELFRAIVERDSRNLEARLWIGRLHSWMGDPDAAEAVFAAVLSEAPASAEAMVGVASTRLARGDAAGALAMLRRAEELAPADADVLAALGRAHMRLGRQQIAVDYAARAASAAPSEENRLLLEDARRQHAHRLEFTGFVEEFGSRAPTASAGDVAVNARVSDRWRLYGRAQVQRKFGISDARAGGGIEWHPQAATTVTAHHLAGPGNEILPRADTLAELSVAGGRLEWAGGMRHMRFASALVWVASPGLTVWASDRLAAGARYYVAFTDFDNASRIARSHSASLRLSYRAAPRLWLTGGYASGIENFETLTFDRIGEFRADTASGGIRLDLPSLTSAYAVYDHQRAAGGAIMHRFTLSIVQRF